MRLVHLDIFGTFGDPVAPVMRPDTLDRLVAKIAGTGRTGPELTAEF